MHRYRNIITLSLITSIIIFTSFLFVSSEPQRLNALNISSSPTAAVSPIIATPTPTPTPLPRILVQTPPPSIAAKVAYLIDAHTGDVLFDRNGHHAIPMASTTKIMTALIAIQTADLDQLIVVGESAYNRVAVEGGSTAYLMIGDRIPLRDLLYALMLPSGNDAAIAIAEALGGTTEGFVDLMNRFAQRLQLYQTHFHNPDGLSLTEEEDNLHYSSARDLVQLAQYAMNIPLFREIVQTQQYELPATDTHGAYVWENTNKLLDIYQGMEGIKTGHTDSAGWCLVFSAQRQNRSLLGVVLRSPEDEQRFIDVENILNWGFELPYA